MNEAIAAAVCQDNYADALTLGPFPAENVDGADVTVQGAGVLAQLFRKSLLGEQSADDREYLLLPGSRHLSNIAGVKFRNQFAGVPAVITASLTGPDIPLVGPVFADVPAVGAPLFVPQSVPLTAGVSPALGPFPLPSSYGAVLVMVDVGNAVGPLWMNVRGTPSGFPAAGINSFYLLDDSAFGGAAGVGRSFFVVEIAGGVVQVDFDHGNVAGRPINSVGIWPTNLPPGTYVPPFNGNMPNSNLSLGTSTGGTGLSVAAAGGNITADLNPFYGSATLSYWFNAVAANEKAVFQVFAIDKLGAIVHEIFRDDLNSDSARVINGRSDIWLPPGHSQVVMTNNTAAGARLLSFVAIGHYGGLP